jgi:nucleoid-associated protein YgaU
MPKVNLKALIMVLAATTFVGCSTVKQIEVRSFIQDKERVDQDMEGNSGYLLGTPKEPVAKSSKTTRRVYVVEFSKSADKVAVQEKTVVDQAGAGAVEQNMDAANLIPSVAEPMVAESEPVVYESEPVAEILTEEPQVEMPRIDDNSVVEEFLATGEYTDYVVEKDDTLQKVSKKFFGNYSKWTKIYEVNKEKIKSPDHIKPGMTIRIPKE